MATKLLLVQDVEDLGRSGDIVSVKPGYARNFLIPQKLAMVADKRALQLQARLQEERKQRAIVDRKESEELAGKLESVVLTTIVKVDHDGHMYGSVTALDIVKMLEEQGYSALEKRSVQLKHPIKTTGSHKIHLKLNEGVAAEVTLKVVAENAREEQAETNAEAAE